MRIALYARVSTLKDQSPEMQLNEMREFCRNREFDIVGEYVDLGVSGSKESRPELNRLMADSIRRKFDAVLVWKLDRFARSLKHLVNALAEFESLKISFISLRDNLDLTTPAGRLMFNVIGAMAEFERDLIRERVRAGMANAKRRGKRLGRKPSSIDIGLVRDLQAQGLPLRRIAQQANTSTASIYRHLSACSVAQ